MGKGELHRISEVFDCWFESGSMPYAQVRLHTLMTLSYSDSFNKTG